MKRLTQTEINKAFRELLAGNGAAWDQVVQVLREGEGGASVLISSTALTVRAAPPAGALGGFLSQLRVTAGRPTLDEIAQEIHVSTASLSRIFCGQVVSNWPTIHTLVEHLGGDPSVAMQMWQEARNGGG